jgi:hypothetical protein
VTITWSIGVGRPWKNDRREAGSLASKAAVKGTHNAALSQTTGIPIIRLGTEAIVRKRRRERF